MRKFNKSESVARVNESIRVSPVLVVKDGKKIGVMSTYKAIGLARDEGLDLVEVSPNASPPVCTIIDYGKYKYEKSKRQKENKQKESVVKEVYLRPATDEHDIQTKIRAIKKFLVSGNKVQIKIKFKRREHVHKDLGFEVINRVIDEVKDFGSKQKDPSLNGRNIICLLSPNKLNND